jgi:cytochrome c-type biogenesis protein
MNSQELQPQNNFPKKLIAVAALLFIIFVVGLLWLAGVREQAAGGTFGFMALLAFAAGLSMIVLPCTLPLVFVIVPLAMGKDYKKGFFMALIFGLGLAITITAYGVAMAYLGQIFGIAAATPWLLLVAGFAAYLFGLSELHIIRFRAPMLAGAFPQSLQEKGDYIKSLGLGLLLGNAGVGCPNPLFYVLLLYIAGTANVGSGALLGFIHGLGRALPIILLTILAMFGFQATKVLSEKRFAIEKFTAWLLIIIGAFLIPAGVFNLRGWWITAIPIDVRAVSLAIGLIALPLVVKQLGSHSTTLMVLRESKDKLPSLRRH